MTMLDAMATRKPRKPVPRKVAQEPPMTFAEAGRKGRLEAQKKVLLASLERTGWSLSETATDLGLTNASNVIRAIREVGLDAEYEAAIAAGKIRRGIRG